MDRNSAVAIANRSRGEFNVPQEFTVLSAEQRIIELTPGPGREPGPVRDLLVWVVRFALKSFWIDLAVDDIQGVVVRREQSR